MDVQNFIINFTESGKKVDSVRRIDDEEIDETEGSDK